MNGCFGAAGGLIYSIRFSGMGLQRDSELYQIDPAQVGEEQARIARAIDDVRQSLTIDARHIEDKLDKNSADIFRAHEAILLDSTVVEELKKTLEAEQIDAEQVVRTVFRRLAGKFRKMCSGSAETVLFRALVVNGWFLLYDDNWWEQLGAENRW